MLHKNTSLGQRVKGLSLNTQQIMALKLMTEHETQNLTSLKLVRFEPKSSQVQPSTCARAANPQNCGFEDNLCAVSDCRRVANPQKVEYLNANEPRTHKPLSLRTNFHELGKSLWISQCPLANASAPNRVKSSLNLSSFGQSP